MRPEPTEDPVAVHDGVEPVGDGEDGAVEEPLTDGLLDQSVSLGVDVGRGLVQDEDPVLSEHRPGQTHQLPLAH